MSEARNGATRILKTAAQWLALSVLVAVAVFYFVGSSGADDRQTPWKAEIWEVEGGEALVAVVQAPTENAEELASSLVLTCGQGIWSLRYDAALPEPVSVEWLDRSALFEFDFGDLSMQQTLTFEAMDMAFFTPLAGTDPLLEAMATGSQVRITTEEPDFPAKAFTLRGSAAALRELRESCQ